MLATAPLQNLGYTCALPVSALQRQGLRPCSSGGQNRNETHQEALHASSSVEQVGYEVQAFLRSRLLGLRSLHPIQRPLQNIEFYKLTFQEAAFAAARTLRETSRTSASAQASALASSARALHRNAWASLRLSFRSLPSLKPLFAQRGPEIFITNVEGYAALAQTVLLRVANGRMNKAIFDGAPRQKVAALLADSQRFLPFRRRDALGAVVLPDGSISSDPDIMSTSLAAFWESF